MKTSSRSTLFVVLGASAIVFIGAFGRFDPVVPSHPTPVAFATTVVSEKLPPVPEQERPSDFSPGMAEVAHLAEARVDSDVILAFIQNSRQTYSPTADEILYLSSLGVPQTVIAALFGGEHEPPASTAVATPPTAPDTAPPQETNSNMFTEALAPYGTWLQVPDYGAAWQPAVEVANPDWKPYVDDGQWINSDSGWYWQSSYSWGWAPFHYGGWVNAPQLGWVWVPGKTWAPAWVSWRANSSFFGWAPLPPGVSLNVLAQLTFNGHPVAPGFDFGLTPSSYVFVRASRFLNSDLSRHLVTASRAATLVAHSAVIQNYRVVNNKIINGGISRDVVAAATKQPVPQVVLEPISANAASISAPPTLLASARQPEYPSALQLPPLPPAPSSVKRDFAQRFEPGPTERPVFRGGDQPRLLPENRPAALEPPRSTSESVAGSSKTTK